MRMNRRSLLAGVIGARAMNTTFALEHNAESKRGSTQAAGSGPRGSSAGFEVGRTEDSCNHAAYFAYPSPSHRHAREGMILREKNLMSEGPAQVSCAASSIPFCAFCLNPIWIIVLL
jgi:hypothetical protein